ncbi:MAG: glutathione S-transferase [Xanthomonadaceae bacterium]|nr:glutathione S-transferase [Xanthomonadaceae bacterium]
MSAYRLHCVGESGNAYKVALMLEFCEYEWEPVFVDFFGGETRSAAYRSEINPFGEVPVLEIEGERIAQSGAILTHLAERSGKFGGQDEKQRLAILGWLLFDNHKFTSYYATLRWMVGLMKTGDPAVIDFLTKRALSAFSIVDKHLANRSFLVGDELTIADLSLVGYQYYEEDTGIDHSAFPNIQAWKRRIASLPRWKHPYDLMPRGFKGG